MEGSQRTPLVRDCVRSFQRLLSVRAGAEASRLVDSLCASIEALARVGSGIEGRLIAAMKKKLGQATLPRHGRLIAAMDDAVRALSSVGWMAPVLRRAQPVPVYFVRHAESTANLEKRLQGCRIGGSLTPNGYLQSQRTADYVASRFQDLGIENVVLTSSPVTRAMETAKALKGKLACGLLSEPALTELDFGDWSGESFAELERDPSYREWMRDAWFNSPPDGESMFEVRTRACEALARLVAAAVAADSALVVVTHFFPLIALFGELMPGEPMRPDNSSITAFMLGEGRWRPVLRNHVGHLGSGATPPVRYV